MNDVVSICGKSACGGKINLKSNLNIPWNG